MDETTKYKIYSLVERDVDAQQIADDLDVSYSTVLRMRREFKEAVNAGTINELLDVTKMLPTTKTKDEVVLDAVSLTAGLKGLNQLDEDLQLTAVQINNRVRSLVTSCEHASELETLTDITCKLQNAFFNKNQTQVNVQNNFGAENNGASRYSQYLSDAPGS